MESNRRSRQIARLIGVLLACTLEEGSAMAETIKFNAESVGKLPEAWFEGVTGRGASQWRVEADESASSPTHVLLQRGKGDFPWCVLRNVAIADGFVETKFKPIAGREDQAGGVIWRWKDGDNYYVARANALENNVSLYYTQHGRRNTIRYVAAPVARNQWHTLRVEFAGKRIRVVFDGKSYIEIDDERISGAGSIGLWTKADSVTAFDDFSYGTTASK
jgi:hypothetical protein